MIISGKNVLGRPVRCVQTKTKYANTEQILNKKQ